MEGLALNAFLLLKLIIEEREERRGWDIPASSAVRTRASHTQEGATRPLQVSLQGKQTRKRWLPSTGDRKGRQEKTRAFHPPLPSQKKGSLAHSAADTTTQTDCPRAISPTYLDKRTLQLTLFPGAN